MRDKSAAPVARLGVNKHHFDEFLQLAVRLDDAELNRNNWSEADACRLETLARRIRQGLTAADRESPAHADL